MASNYKAVYTHEYKNFALAGLDFRTEQSRAYLLPHLEPGVHVLDNKPGPGTITLRFAETVAPGGVTGIELGKTYVNLANEDATKVELQNLKAIQDNALDL